MGRFLGARARRASFVVIAGLVAVLASAPGSFAGTVRLAGSELRWEGGFSETNTVTITKGGFLEPYVVRDTTAPLGAGEGCSTQSGGVVHCGGGFVVIASIYANAGSLADIVVVNSDAPATIIGGTNSDTLTGGSGADTIYGDVRSISEGQDCDNRPDIVDGREGNDTIYGGGNSGGCFGGGPGVDVLRGGANDDTIYGDYGASCPYGGICGHTGPDRLEGGPNDDKLHGQEGDDVLNDGGFHWDELRGGPGTDTAEYTAHGTAAIVIDLRRTEPQGQSGENDKIFEIENVTTGIGRDQLLGTDGPNVLRSGSEHDTLEGFGGTDRYEAGDGNDTIESRDGIVEDILCGAGADSVVADSADVVNACETVDAPPAISIEDTSVTEGNGGTRMMTFRIELDRTTSQQVTVQWATRNGTAVAGSDYNATSGTATVPGGSLETTVSVPVIGDTLDEDDETIFVDLSNKSANADRIADPLGQGTIVDDDAAVAVSIGDVTVVEGNHGLAPVGATFTLSLSRPSGRTVAVDYATVGLTAGVSYWICYQPGAEVSCGYHHRPAEDLRAPHEGDCAPGGLFLSCTVHGGRLTFAPGTTSRTVFVEVNGDNIDEPDETFRVDLSSPANATLARERAFGTIQDDDPLPAISISDPSAAEGDSGTTPARFAVTLSRPSASDVTVSYATANGTAVAPADYGQLLPGTLTIPAGQTGGEIVVSLEGDVIDEPDEDFFVDLTLPVNATLLEARGAGTIVDDDVRPVATSAAATSVTRTGAALNAMVNPSGRSTSVHFQYGTTTTYGKATAPQTAGSTMDAQPISAVLTGLRAGTTYHFRVVATNDAGIAYGDRMTFKTAPPPPCRVPRLKGKTLKGAKAALVKKNCRIGGVKRAFSAKVRKGRVMKQTRKVGATLPYKAKVGVTLSKGKRRR